MTQSVSPKLRQKMHSPKYHQLMKTAEDLFMRYGIKRVTVEEICRTASVSKMTFYKFFRNKGDLAKQLIINLMDEGQVVFDDIMSQDVPFAEKINRFIQFKLDYGKRFSKEFYQDFMGYDPEIREFILDRSRQGMNQMMDLFREAQQRGQMRKDINLEFVSFILDHLLDLKEDPRLLSIYPNVYELARDWLNLFFYGIMGRNERDKE